LGTMISDPSALVGRTSLALTTASELRGNSRFNRSRLETNNLELMDWLANVPF